MHLYAMQIVRDVLLQKLRCGVDVAKVDASLVLAGHAEGTLRQSHQDVEGLVRCEEERQQAIYEDHLLCASLPLDFQHALLMISVLRRRLAQPENAALLRFQSRGNSV